MSTAKTSTLAYCPRKYVNSKCETSSIQFNDMAYTEALPHFCIAGYTQAWAPACMARGQGQIAQYAQCAYAKEAKLAKLLMLLGLCPRPRLEKQLTALLIPRSWI